MYFILDSKIYDRDYQSHLSNRERYIRRLVAFPAAIKGTSSTLDNCSGHPFIFNFHQQDADLSIPVIGCYGVESSWLSPGSTETFRYVTQQMAALPKVDFVVSTGDQFYTNGVKSVTSPHFNYLDEHFSKGILQNKIRMHVLGNHDYAIHHHADSTLLNPLSAGISFFEKIDRAFNQVDRTYYRGNRTWFMPYRYYAVTTRDAIFFYLDSNTLPIDAIQQQWFMSIYDIYKEKKWKILVMHHPLRQHGKRSRKDYRDIDCYVPEGALNIDSKPLRLAFAYYTNWNDLLLDTLNMLFVKTRQEKPIHLLLSAHDHFLSMSRIQGLPGQPWQIISGGGGGALSEVVTLPTLEEQSAGAIVKKEYGFVLVNISAEKIRAEMHTLAVEIQRPSITIE